MTKRLYDLGSSAKRVESARKAVCAQQRHLAMLSSAEILASDDEQRMAKTRLLMLESMLDIVEKTHSMIVDFMAARPQDAA